MQKFQIFDLEFLFFWYWICMHYCIRKNQYSTRHEFIRCNRKENNNYFDTVDSIQYKSRKI